jgi:hypothetical protein
MITNPHQTFRNPLKPLAILLVVGVIATMLWPLYRKFFIDEWRERIVSGLPVVFVPDCPVVSGHFKCHDLYTIAFRKNEYSQWCARVRKNEEPGDSESCGLDVDAWDFARSWRYFTIDGVRLYYSWRGRVIISPNQVAGWLDTPEDLTFRKDHPLAIE